MQEETVQPQDAQNSDKPLEQQLAEAHARIEQQRDTMLRAVADAENARKRAQNEAAVAQKYALERFAESLLPVIDSLEAALGSDQAIPESVREGVELTLRQFLSALEKAKITVVNPQPGERFDPHRHHAMATVEADSDPNSIVSVMQKGYQLHDRVLRPALVTVSRPLEKSGRNPNSNIGLDQKAGD